MGDKDVLDYLNTVARVWGLRGRCPGRDRLPREDGPAPPRLPAAGE
ncbi:hypothetical protein [Methanoculleus chikugoensis]|nr:hypothetical protein [Methanoculleus chikugoensis]